MDILIVFRTSMGIGSTLNSWLMVLLYCLCKTLLDSILCDRSYVYVRVEICAIEKWFTAHYVFVSLGSTVFTRNKVIFVIWVQENRIGLQRAYSAFPPHSNRRKSSLID